VLLDQTGCGAVPLWRANAAFDRKRPTPAFPPRSSAAGRGVKVFTYDLRDTKRFGDLPELLDVTVTPSVAVIGRDRRLGNLFRGLTDAELLRQAMSDAKSVAPATS